MDNLFKIVNDGEIITITGDELLLITFVERRIYQKYKINKPEVPNKLAGYPYWVFEYKDVLFNLTMPNFLEALETNDFIEVKLIRCGKYFNIYSYCTKKQVNELNIKIAKRGKITGLLEKMKVSKLSLIEEFELVEWYNASKPR
ncbi:MAG TPA: hypothetical protein PLD18_03000 [Flavobacterium sp.]|nr:hypothetical protein [Flavobacterium sp.]